MTFSVLLGACAASDDNKSSAPVAPSSDIAPTAAPTTEPEVVPEVVQEAPTTIATPSIASVQIKQDCPDPKVQPMGGSPKPAASMGFAASEPAPGASRKRAKSRSPGNGSGFRAFCSQSTLQLSFTGQEGKSSSVALKQVRLQSADGKALGSLASRLPTIWKESGYEVWDGTLEPGADHKTSYKLSVPNWSDVEATLGGSSYGKMFTVEVDVEIDGQLTTLTSPQFERGRPQNIRT